jgi:hypothetical protein
MADDDEDEGDVYEEFKKDIRLVDEFASLVLRGHYVLERDIDRIIRYIFFHPERILGEPFVFNFDRKLRLARAMSRNASEHPHWDVVIALNALRNTIAHHGYEDRQVKIERLRELCSKTAKLEKHEKEHGSGYMEVVTFAFTLGTAFLAHIEEDLENLRQNIDGLIAAAQESGQPD